MLVKQITSLTKAIGALIIEIKNIGRRNRERPGPNRRGAYGETTQNLSGKRTGFGRNSVKLLWQHRVGNAEEGCSFICGILSGHVRRGVERNFLRLCFFLPFLQKIKKECVSHGIKNPFIRLPRRAGRQDGAVWRLQPAGAVPHRRHRRAHGGPQTGWPV